MPFKSLKKNFLSIENYFRMIVYVNNIPDDRPCLNKPNRKQGSEKNPILVKHLRSRKIRFCTSLE